ncbi:hypothetical protein H4R26_003623 [Coemansia thaxteri]|uniref:Uncharacterized protein n=1 Tax=Coemansia thaxteri TaxID=2663907 RepID=A0A9W8BC82_9FUNG|nr:hypothetical protein H4R26_003623 [Coemansia thaxteri]
MARPSSCQRSTSAEETTKRQQSHSPHLLPSADDKTSPSELPPSSAASIASAAPESSSHMSGDRPSREATPQVKDEDEEDEQEPEALTDASSIFKSIPGMPSNSKQISRTVWTAEADYSFVKTLVRHTSCDSTRGLTLNHYYVDTAVIQLVEEALSRGVDVKTVTAECQQRFPNKNETHYSVESLELLQELSKKCPGFSFQQLNQKHMNMWTRSIVPFRQVFDTGMLYKGKQLFHKDCKRFAKVFISFFAFVVQNGLSVNYCPTLMKSSGQASKLLEQWVGAMFEQHGIKMSQFMYQCGLRLCRAYVCNKQSVYRTVSEHAILSSPNPPANEIQVVLKSYFGYICEYEDVSPSAKFEMDTRNMHAYAPYMQQPPAAEPQYAQPQAQMPRPHMSQMRMPPPPLPPTSSRPWQQSGFGHGSQMHGMGVRNQPPMASPDPRAAYNMHPPWAQQHPAHRYPGGHQYAQDPLMPSMPPHMAARYNHPAHRAMPGMYNHPYANESGAPRHPPQPPVARGGWPQMPEHSQQQPATSRAPVAHSLLFGSGSGPASSSDPAAEDSVADKIGKHMERQRQPSSNAASEKQAKDSRIGNAVDKLFKGVIDSPEMAPKRKACVELESAETAKKPKASMFSGGMRVLPAPVLPLKPSPPRDVLY